MGITPAMPTGSSLKQMMDEIPERAFDVGIAEQHAVTLAAGMAAEGLIPFCAIYSTFLQRAYDQIIHDVALQNLPVILCLDRAGVVGQDGATHHGVFDLAYLRCIPNLIIFAPMDGMELRNIMYTVQKRPMGPVAIRYPRGSGTPMQWRRPMVEIPLGQSRELRKGSQIAVLSLGTLGNGVGKVIDAIDQSHKIGHYDMRFLKPLDTHTLQLIFNRHSHIITLENGCKAGGFGSAVLEAAQEMGYTGSIEILAIDDVFLEHGTQEQLYEIARIDTTALRNRLKKILDVQEQN
ncbi:MAG: transketolase C-terminal domain-containing protein [Bacteroidota bacterium]